MLGLLTLTRRAAMTPLDGNRPAGFGGLPRQGGGSCAMPSWHASLMKRHGVVELPPVDNGFAPGRRHEGATMVGLISTYRVARAGLSSVEGVLDMTNAFQYTDWDKQEEALRALVGEEVAPLYTLRYRMGSVHIMDPQVEE